MIDASAIRGLERLALRATPAAEEMPVGGWRLRVHGGPWRRANSVQTIDDPGEDVASLAARCVETYRARGCRTIFKLSPASRPDDVDERLAALGFVREAPTRVMILALGSTRPAAPLVTLHPRVDDAWVDAMIAWEPGLEPHRAPLRDLLERIEPTRRFARLDDADGRPVSIGLGVLDGDHVGLFDLMTDPAARSRGHGTRVVEALLDWGRHGGAKTAWLQVMDDNPGAYRLYERLGFEDAYPYWYRVSSDDPTP